MHMEWVKDEPEKAGKYVFYDGFAVGSVIPPSR